jgi:hypothetical protein
MGKTSIKKGDLYGANHPSGSQLDIAFGLVCGGTLSTLASAQVSPPGNRRFQSSNRAGFFDLVSDLMSAAV